MNEYPIARYLAEIDALKNTMSYCRAEISRKTFLCELQLKRLRGEEISYEATEAENKIIQFPSKSSAHKPQMGRASPFTRQTVFEYLKIVGDKEFRLRDLVLFCKQDPSVMSHGCKAMTRRGELVQVRKGVYRRSESIRDVGSTGIPRMG